MAVAAVSAGVSNSATADAVSGGNTPSTKAGKTKTDFMDALDAILSGQPAQPAVTAATPQDNSPSPTADSLRAQAIDALRGKDTADSDREETGLAANIAAPQAATAQATASDATLQSGHGTLTAATQAKLVSALAQAANKSAAIAGSDGTTSASSDQNGTPSTEKAQTESSKPAPSETDSDTAQVLSAMQAGQPVVTTVATSGTTPSVTARTMPQLEKAALGNTAQQAMHTAAPASKIEAQVLNAPADAKTITADGNSGSQTGTDGKQSQDQSADTQTKIDTAQPDLQTVITPDATQSPNTATAITAANASAIGNGVAGVSAPSNITATPTAIATSLHIAQQSAHTNIAQPDIAALAVSIAAKSKDGQNEFNIRMEPAELGRVDVRLSVDASGKAQAHLTADSPQTLDLLRSDKSTLENSLKDAGLNLSNDGLNFSLKGQQQNSTPTFVARNRALSISAVQTTDTISSTSGTSTTPGSSRLDIRV